jgi:hypothetical protein
MRTGKTYHHMSQTTLERNELQDLLTEKLELERMVEHYREEFKKARGKAKEYKRMLREINLKIKIAEMK